MLKYFPNHFASFASFAFILFFVSLGLAQTPNGETKDDNTTPRVTQIDEERIKELLKPSGKPLLVNFWATWCEPCREEFPDLVEIDKEYRGKIDFITITLDDLAEINRDVPKFLDEMKATMPTYLLYTNDENGVIGSISKDWEGGLPFTVLYEASGKVAHTKQGRIKPEVVRSKLNKMLVKEIVVDLPQSSLKREYSYEQGIADARKDVSQGKYFIKRYGLTPGISEESRRKLKEKYNIQYQEYGCVVWGGFPEYVKGYNKISKAAIKKKFGLHI